MLDDSAVIGIAGTCILLGAGIWALRIWKGYLRRRARVEATTRWARLDFQPPPLSGPKPLAWPDEERECFPASPRMIRTVDCFEPVRLGFPVVESTANYDVERPWFGPDGGSDDSSASSSPDAAGEDFTGGGGDSGGGGSGDSY